MNITIIQTIEVTDAEIAQITARAPFTNRTELSLAVRDAMNPYGQTADKRINWPTSQKIADSLVENGVTTTKADDPQYHADNFQIKDFPADEIHKNTSAGVFPDEIKAGEMLKKRIKAITGATPKTLCVNAMISDLVDVHVLRIKGHTPHLAQKREEMPN